MHLWLISIVINTSSVQCKEADFVYLKTSALALYSPGTGMLLWSFPTHVLHFTLDPNTLSVLFPSSANSSVSSHR